MFTEKKEINLLLHHYKRYLNPVSQPASLKLRAQDCNKIKVPVPENILSKTFPLFTNLPNTKDAFFVLFFRYVESKANYALINVLQGNTFIFEVFVL